MCVNRRCRAKRWVFVFLIVSVALTLTIVSSPRSAAAHPADMYYQAHTVVLGPEGLSVEWTIAPGTLLAYAVWQNADDDRDGLVSPSEAAAWVNEQAGDYTVSLNGEPLAVQIEGVEWPESLVEFELGTQRIVVHLAASWAVDAWPGLVTLTNRFEDANSTNWFSLDARGELAFRLPQQRGGMLSIEIVSPGEQGAHRRWDSSTPALGSYASAAQPQPGNATSQARAQLTRLISEDRLSAMFILTALVIALGLGAIHALTPGHGKALVGAYLVGSKGTLRHAVALGGIVTLTHTGSVMAFGIVALAASRYIMPTDLFPVLEVLSGVLIVGLGGLLLYRRWRGWFSVRALHQRQQAVFAPVRRSPAMAGSGTSRTIQINQAIPVNVFDEVLPGQGAGLGAVNWHALVALGVSGGLVPCPDAIAILLVAVAINRIVLGLSLIVAFSLGLAAVLTVIGIAMVRSRRVLGRFAMFDRAAPFLPVLSALIVTMLGLLLTMSAIRRSGWLGTQEASAPGNSRPAQAATFDITTASFLFLGVDRNNSYQIMRRGMSGDLTTSLTDEPLGVWDYAISPDGQQVIYAAPRASGGSDLWLINADGSSRQAEPVVACSQASCTRPLWSPDGTRVVYERTDLISATTPGGNTSLWWVDIQTREAAPVFQDSQFPGFSPEWSPDGNWLSFSTPGAGSIQLYHLAEGSRRSIPNQTGNPVTWGPDSQSVLVTDIWTDAAGQVYTHLFRHDLGSGQVSDLTGPGMMGDTWSAWSPDGAWVAIVRRDFGGATQGMGDQVWIMRPDGSDARPLTDVPDVIHGAPVWSPDSRYLIFERFPLAGSQAAPGIFVLDVTTRDLRPVASAGNWPRWLPG